LRPSSKELSPSPARHIDDSEAGPLFAGEHFPTRSWRSCSSVWRGLEAIPGQQRSTDGSFHSRKTTPSPARRLGGRAICAFQDCPTRSWSRRRRVWGGGGGFGIGGRRWFKLGCSPKRMGGMQRSGLTDPETPIRVAMTRKPADSESWKSGGDGKKGGARCDSDLMSFKLSAIRPGGLRRFQFRAAILLMGDGRR
jgi:hypothetical protein